MKIFAVDRVQYNKSLSFKQNNSIEHLSGLDVVKKYELQRQKSQKEKNLENEELNNVLYNSILLMAQKGLYKDAKILYEAFVNNTALEDNPELNNAIGNINKKMGDVEEARNNYNLAMRNISSAENGTKLDIIKNFYEIQILSGENELDKDVFKDETNPHLNEMYLYLSSAIDDSNNNSIQAANEIKAAYKIMKDIKYRDDDVILKTALVLSEEGDYEKSNEIILENLNLLKEEGRTYTKEFTNYLLLLGINEFETSDEKNLNPSTNIFRNVSEIAEKIGLQQTREIADYSVAKNLFIEKSEDFVEFAQKMLESTKNKQYKINVNEMLGDFIAAQDKTQAAQYYKTAKSMIDSDEASKKQIFELCKKIKKVLPQESAQIDEEIKNLNAESMYNTHYLSKTLMNVYSKEDYKKLEEITTTVSNNANNKTNEALAKVFLNLAKLQQGSDMERCLKQADNELKYLIEELKKSPDNKDLQKSIYFIYKNKALILHKAMSYAQAASAINEAIKYFNEDNYKKENIIKDKIIATLINYKAQNYNTAESLAIKYLELLLDKKFESTKPTKITSEVNEILTQKNDTEKRKIAAAYETLGLINLKNMNVKDSQDYFMEARDIRERLKDKDWQLANTYAALARLAILNSKLFKTKRPNSSKEMHDKCLEILKLKYPNAKITRDEEEFQRKYYGISMASAGKYMRRGIDKKIIEKFKCYNEELSICD